jgi:hypothetical protein
MTNEPSEMTPFAERLRSHQASATTQAGLANVEMLVYSTDRHGRFAPDFMQVGGLADRFKGIVMAYLIAVYFGRAFAIDWNKPAALAPTLEHAGFDWRPSTWRNAMLGARAARHVDLIDGIGLLETLAPEDVAPLLFGRDALTYVNVNVFSHTLIKRMYPDVEPNDAFQAAFENLFRFTVPPAFASVWSEIETMRASHDGIVGVHLRTGDGNGWNDPAMGSWEKAPDALAQAANFATEIGLNKPAFYFASDSARAKAAVRAMPFLAGPVMTVDRDIQHIDRSDIEGRDSFDFAVVEFMALARADAIIGGAGQYWFAAAMAGGKPHRRFE